MRLAHDMAVLPRSIIVAGAGALGLTCALRLARAGAAVTLVQPQGPPSASAVAAGMLAPGLESLFDDASPPFTLLAAARDQWPPLAEGIGLSLDASGAWAVGGETTALRDRLLALGARAVVRDAPEPLPVGPALFTPEDWRLEPGAALEALGRALLGAGGVIVDDRLAAFEPGQATLRTGVRMAADLLVLATGFAPEAAALVPETALLRPIKGQILRAAQGGGAGLVVRGDGVYVCRDKGGVTVGATMQGGLSDLTIEPKVVHELQARAAALIPFLADLRFSASAGVRAATSDGLPLVGWSRAPGVLIAGGARRNGWLLAPMIAERICALAMGETPDPLGDVFDPARFTPED